MIKNSVFRKGMVLAIMVLFIGAGVIPSISGDTSELSSIEEVDSFVFSESNSAAIMDIIYVNDNAPPDWYDATHVKTIQEGINNASIGDTIQVYSGKYYESININIKNLKLEGINHEHDSSEEIGMPIIDALGSGNVVDISAGGVIFSGFIIRNSGKNEGNYGIEIHTNENLILGNNIKENNDGIIISDCNNIIEDNIITDNNNDGIWLSGSSSNNCISGNTITNNEVGIGLFSSSDNNIISDNTITNNYYGGIWIFGSGSNNCISGNTITNNYYYGVLIAFSSSNNYISGNTITNNYYYGVQISGSSKYNFIIGNNISFNDKTGIKIVDESTPNFIHHNNFVYNDVNAYDECSNQWDNGSEGNYWYDYTGIDEDENGIGDVPYDKILGGDSKDNFPFMNILSIPVNIPPEKPDRPSGPGTGRAGEEYEYSSLTTDPNGDKLSYLFDWDDGTSGIWLGPFNSGQTVSIPHIWLGEGLYQIKVKAKDINGRESPWSEPLDVTITKNRATHIPFLRFLEQYPILYQLLQRLLRL